MPALPPQVQPYDMRRADLQARYDNQADPITLDAAQDRVRLAFLLGDLDEQLYTRGQAALQHPLLAEAPTPWRDAYQGGFACQAARQMFLPLAQYSAVQQGLATVQAALRQHPDVELFFLQTSILFRLPVFLPERGKLDATAQVTLKRLDQLEPLPPWFQREILIFFWELDARYQADLLPRLLRMVDG